MSGSKSFVSLHLFPLAPLIILRAGDTMLVFFDHAYVAHVQADAFDDMIDRLPEGQLVMLADYSMSE